MPAAEGSPIRVVGRYALYNPIAAGGMATIHLGRLLGPVGFARTVAVKRLHPQYARDPEFVSMFLDEARLAARVQHPNVVATIDVVASEGELFLIMDYVRGESLSKILRAVGKKDQHVPPPIAVAIVCGFLHGLHSAHEAKNERGEPLNLVHRDVSPQNVLVGSDGVARVLDFGIAKAAGRLQVTRDGQIKGKLAYMPPEQVTGRELTQTVDVYAAAVVMWEMLTGERLFKGANETETLGRILRDPVPSPSSVLPSLPTAFDPVLAKALSREPSKRHATAKELALELERCCAIASANTVGEWVEQWVGAVLSTREAQIAEIESSSVSTGVAPAPESDSVSDSSASAPDAAALLRATNGTRIHPAPNVDDAFPPKRATNSDAPTQTRPQIEISEPDALPVTAPFDRRILVLSGIAAAVGLAFGGGLVFRARYASHEEAKPVASATAAAIVDSAVAPALVLSASNHEAPLASSSAVIPAASASAHALPARPSATASQPAPVTIKQSCDPPYTIDTNGRRKYKRQCM